MAADRSSEFETTLHLVYAANAGDRQALEELFERYLPRVRQIVALRTGKRLREIADVEDITQETLLSVFKGLSRFEARSEGTFRNWVARCVECEVVRQLRFRQARKRGGGRVVRFDDLRSQGTLSSALAARSPSPSEVVAGKELAEKLEDALLKMPEHHREMIILRALCEMSYGEIAEAIGFAGEVTARKAYSRAMFRLKQMLA